MRLTPLIAILLILFIGMSMGCNVTKYVPKGKLLLKNEVVIKGAQDVDTEGVIRVKPNQRVLAPKLYLSLFNIGTNLARDSSLLKKWFVKKPGRKRFFDNTTNWMRDKIGERPILIEVEELKSDSARLKGLLNASGYYDAEVNYYIDTVGRFFNAKKGNVYFEIDRRSAYRVRKHIRNINDWDLVYLHQLSRGKSPLQAGDIINYQTLTRERLYLTDYFRNKGYFAFAPKMISFEVDSFLTEEIPKALPGGLAPGGIADSVDSWPGAKWLDVTTHISGRQKQYSISEITLNIIAFDDREKTWIFNRIRAEELDEEQREGRNIPKRRLRDSLGLTFFISPEIEDKFQFNFISQRLYIAEGDLYHQRDSRRSLSRLQELGMFQYVILKYEDIDHENGTLKVRIEMKISPKYQFKTGVELSTADLSNSGILPAVGGSLNFRDKNAFRHSEAFDLSLGGDIGTYPAADNLQRIFWQLQGKADLSLPRFVLPIPTAWLPADWQKFSTFRPSTSISTTFRTEQRREYDQTTVGLALNYRWYHQTQNETEQSQLSLIDLDIISLSDVDSDFQNQIDKLNDAIKQAFLPRFSSKIVYAYTNSDYGNMVSKNTRFRKFNAEIGGNMPYLLDCLSGDCDGSDQILLIGKGANASSLGYGQYMKLGFEYKEMLPIKKGMELVWRTALGGSFSFNKTRIVPPQSRYFLGGPNSMRGWSARTLGPGTLEPEAESINGLLALGGEYAWESNIELRFDLYQYLELAIFSDIGNVWFSQRALNELDDENERAILKRANFLPGWDAGVGFRLDFSFLIIRFDMAQQIFAPDLLRHPERKGWVIRDFPLGLGGNRWQLQFGIGYPF